MLFICSRHLSSNMWNIFVTIAIHLLFYHSLLLWILTRSSFYYLQQLLMFFFVFVRILYFCALFFHCFCWFSGTFIRSFSSLCYLQFLVIQTFSMDYVICFYFFWVYLAENIDMKIYRCQLWKYLIFNFIVYLHFLCFKETQILFKKIFSCLILSPILYNLRPC